MTLLGKGQQAKSPKDLEYEMMVEEMHQITNNIRIIECNFNLINDNDLVDYYILQLKAEQTRQSYLLKKLRAHTGNNECLVTSMSLKN